MLNQTKVFSPPTDLGQSLQNHERDGDPTINVVGLEILDAQWFEKSSPRQLKQQRNSEFNPPSTAADFEALRNSIPSNSGDYQPIRNLSYAVATASILNQGGMACDGSQYLLLSTMPAGTGNQNYANST